MKKSIILSLILISSVTFAQAQVQMVITAKI
jgi:hypothetical protein